MASEGRFLAAPAWAPASVRPWTSRLRAPAVFVAALVALQPYRDGSWTSYNFDAFIFTYDTRRVLEGHVPYRDFFEFIGPGTLWLQAAWMDLFGPTAGGVQALLVLTLALLGAGLYALAVRVTGRPWLSLVVPAFVLLTIPPHWPWPYHQWYSLTAAAAALLAAAHWVAGGRRAWLVAAGVLCAVTGLFTQTWGTGMVVAIGGFLLLRSRWPAVVRDVAWFGGGAAGAALLVLGYFAAVGGAGSFLYDTMVFPPTHMVEINRVPFAVDLAAWTATPGSGAWHRFLRLAPYATYALPLLGVAVSAAIAGLGLLRRVRRAADETDPAAETLLLCAVTTLVLFVLVLQVRTDLFHLAWATLFVYPTLVGAACRAVPRPSMAWLAGAAMLVLIASAGTRYVTSVEAAGPAQPLDAVVERDGLVRYVQSHTGPDDTVAVIGWGGPTYFYARQPALTYTLVLDREGWMSPAIRRQVEAEIATKRPRLVVFFERRTCCDVALPAGYDGPQRVVDDTVGVAYVVYTRR